MNMNMINNYIFYSFIIFAVLFLLLLDIILTKTDTYTVTKKTSDILIIYITSIIDTFFGLVFIICLIIKILNHYKIIN